MSRFFKSKLVLGIAIVTLTAIISLFALDSWYKGFGPTYERLQGRWIIGYSSHWEGVHKKGESCGNNYNSNKPFSFNYIDWTNDKEVVVWFENFDNNKAGTGTYELAPPWSIDNHETTMKIDMDFPVTLPCGELISGNYIVEMDNINELTLSLEGDPQDYQIGFHRPSNKFDLSVIMDFLYGF